MPMLDSFFAKSFKPTKCKALLKLTIPRIKLLRNRREVQLRQMRREIAKLLETGQEATARIRVEHILREEKMMAAQEIIELFCELIAVRLPIIEAQRECPVDLKEAISSLCFAAPRCSADLPELLQVQLLFAGKYGKEFVSAATELMPECGVNQQLVELLSIRAPAPDIKLKLLKDIAQEHELNWDPSASESELMKLQEDLLTGSPSYASDHKLPFHAENHYATKSTTSTSEPATSHNHSHSAIAVAMVDILEAPKNQRKGRASVSAPEMLRFAAPTVSQVNDQTEPYPSLGNDNLQWNQSGDAMQEKSDKQYVPPADSPSQSSAHNSPTSVSMPRYNNAELREVLAAAEAAAITAEYAAATARSAADIAQLRISELAKRQNNQALKSTMENPFHLDRPEANVGEKDGFYFWGTNNNPVNSVAHRAYSDQKGYSDSSPSGCNVFSSSEQPPWMPSMDNEDYFAYPNLFTSESSNLSSPT